MGKLYIKLKLLDPGIVLLQIIGNFCVPAEAVRKCLLTALTACAKDSGKYPGLLDSRPEKGKSFGTFEVTDIWSE